MEAHHLIPMKYYYDSDYNHDIDVPGNIVSLCPNCHRKVHHGTNDVKESLIRFLYEKRREKLKTFGILVSLDKLLKYYL